MRNKSQEFVHWQEVKKNNTNKTKTLDNISKTQNLP